MKKAYLEITLNVSPANRANAGSIYAKYKQPFLTTIPGAESKDLLIREDDVQVLHGFASRTAAEDYLKSGLFENDIVRELQPCLAANPDIRIYERH
jgi:hypothetical protein